MTTPFPTMEQVRALICPLERVIPEHFADANGHMNIVRYLELHNDAGWIHMSDFGLGEEHATAGSAGSFQTELHMTYLREVHVGDVVAVHVRLVERSAKAIHLVQFLVNLTRGEVANTFESLGLSVDLASRKVVPFPQPVAELLDAQLAIDQALDWPAPHASAIRVR